MIPRPRHHAGRWTAGLDAAGGDRSADGRRRLHAVSASGLVEGRAVCLTRVSVLDPALWAWPDDADDVWPLCWTCLAATHRPCRDAAPAG